MAKKSTDVAVNPPDAETQNLPSTDVIDYESYAGMGREEAHAEDYAIPFLRILQKGSPEVDENDGKYIEGAKPGDFHNTVSGQVYSGKAGLRAIPCMFRREYIEWVPRDAGGGFVGTHAIDSPVIRTATKGGKNDRELVLPNGNTLVDTYYEYCIIETPDGGRFTAVLGFTSTQTKKARKWNTMTGQKRITLDDGRIISDPPSFAFYYDITTIGEKNESGSWYGWHIEEVQPPEDRVSARTFKEALSFYKQVSSGEVKRAPEAGAHGGDTPYQDNIPGFEDIEAQEAL